MKKLVSFAIAAVLACWAQSAAAQTQSPLIGTWLDQDEGMIIQISWCHENATTLCALVISEKIKEGELSLRGQTIVRDIKAVAPASGETKMWRGRLTADGLPKAKVEMKLRSQQNLEATYCAGWFCETSRYIRQ